MNIIFWTTEFHYCMHVQLKFAIPEKIQVNEINSWNISKGHENSPNLNIEYQVLYKGCTKNLVAKIQKKINFFAECQSLALGKEGSLPSAKRGALGKEDDRYLGPVFVECHALPSAILCRVSGTRQSSLCRVSGLCRVFFGWHSTKRVFAECSIKSTRQSLKHSAKMLFPVVVH